MRSTLTLKALGLCALTVGVMAVTASAAQAEATSRWMEAGTNIIGAGQSSEVLGTLENNIGRLLTKINGLGFEITCTAVALQGFKLIKEGSTLEGTATFTDCLVFKVSPLEKLGECLVHSPGDPSGTIKTLPLRGLLELHTGGKAVVLIISLNGVIAHLEFDEPDGEACGVLPEEVLINGTLAVEDCENKLQVEQLTHLITEEPTLSHLWVVSDTPEHKVTLDGSINLDLENDANWSGLPG